MTLDAVRPETGSPKNRQQQRTERSTNALLEAAIDLVVEGGLDALTFAAIGDRAGYSRGLVTARFGSKDGLIDALIERIVTRWSHRNVIPRTVGRSGLEGIAILIEAIETQLGKDPRGIRVLYSLMFAAIGGDDGLRKRFARFQDTIRSDVAAFVRRGRQDGSIRGDVDADREGALVVAGLRGIGYQWLIDPEHFDPVDALGYLGATTDARLRA